LAPTYSCWIRASQASEATEDARGRGDGEFVKLFFCPDGRCRWCAVVADFATWICGLIDDDPGKQKKKKKKIGRGGESGGEERRKEGFEGSALELGVRC
jgi:hypothetical protein